MSEKQFEYYEEENGEFPIPYIKTNDGRKIMTLYECCNLLNELSGEKKKLKEELWGAVENYLHEAYHDNPIREEYKLKEFEEDFKRGYWND